VTDLIPDLPPTAGRTYETDTEEAVDTISCLPYVNGREKYEGLPCIAAAFIYYVSITGITGTKLTLDPAIVAYVADQGASRIPPLPLVSA